MARQRKITDDLQVKVFNNATGHLFYKNNTNDIWEWPEHGFELDIPVKELKNMKQYGWLRYFEDQWLGFQPEDEDVLNHLNLGKFYKDLVTQDDIDSYFSLSDAEFEQVLDQLISEKKTNVQSLLVEKAKEKFATKELINTHIIKLIQDKFNVQIES